MALVDSFVTDALALSARVKRSKKKTEGGTGTLSRNVRNKLPTKALPMSKTHRYTTVEPKILQMPSYYLSSIFLGSFYVVSVTNCSLCQPVVCLI